MRYKLTKTQRKEQRTQESFQKNYTQRIMQITKGHMKVEALFNRAIRINEKKLKKLS